MKALRLCLWVLLSAVALYFPRGVNAADNQEVQKLAGMDLLQLREVPIVSAARHEQNRADSPRAVSVITAEEIRRRNFRNVPEAVAGLTGVFLQQTNYAGGSPILRGMVGNRVLLMVNGIRLNNAIYRLGPNQYLNFIDIRQVERIEIVRGAGSVLYGSDAFGGVINIITKSAPDPLMGQELSGRVEMRFGSADRSGSGRAEFSGTHGGLGFFGGYTREGFGDLRSGGGLQLHTGYSQWSGDAELRYSLSEHRSLTAGFTRLRQSGVDRTDVVNAGSDLEYLWNPEGRDLVYLQYAHSKVNRFINALHVTGAYQRPIEYVTRVQASAPGTRRYLEDVVQSGNLVVQLNSSAGSRNELTYGLEISTDRVASQRTDLQLLAGVRTSAKGNYVDGSTFRTVSLFLQDEVVFAARLRGVFGIRRDWYHLDADARDAAVGLIAVESKPQALTGSGYLLYDLTSHWSAVLGVSQAFRAPNLDDSTVLGGNSGRYDIPNSRLSPEHSTNFEYGLRAKSKSGTASLVFFDDRYRDLIDRAPALWNGLSFVDSNGNGVKDGKELDVYQRQNLGRASVRGLEVEWIVNLTPRWTWTHTMTWTHGTDDSLHTPLTRIPPFNGVSRITWQPIPAFWSELALVAATGQHRLSPSDLTDVRIGPAGTAGFGVWTIRSGLQRTKLAGLSLAWENIGGKRYRLHGSGFDRPGMGVVLGYTRVF